MLIPTTILTTGGGGAFAHIQTSALGSDVASVTFSSIPSTYEHLIVIWTARGTAAGNPDLNMTFNGDTGTNYDREIVIGAGATAAAGAAIGASSITTVGSLPGSGAAAGRAAGGIIVVSSYARTTFHKTGFALWSDIRGTGAGDQVGGITAGIWLSTAAVTSLTLAASSANLLTGSVFSLYGVAGS